MCAFQNVPRPPCDIKGEATNKHSKDFAEVLQVLVSPPRLALSILTSLRSN